MLDYQSNKKEKNIFSLRDLHTVGSSSTVVAQENHVAVSANQFTTSFQSSECSTFAAKSISQQANKYIAAENLFSLKNKPSCLRWYHLTYRSQLEYLLELARSKEQIKLISHDDLSLVIKCCNYQETLIFSERKKLKRLAIEILTYFAEYKISLPENAINALLTELKNKDQRTLGNVLYALSLAVCNGHDLKMQESELLTSAIRNFFETANKSLHLSVAVLGLLTLAKQGVEFKSEELEFLRKSLAYLGDDKFESIFLPPTVNAQYHSDDRHGSWDSFKILGRVKELAKKNQLLSKKEITFFVRHWHTENSIAKKLKVIQILRYIILNGQNDFTEPAIVESVLKEALVSPVRKIRAHAIVAAVCLVKLYTNKTPNPYKQLAAKLNLVLEAERLHVLHAINLFLCKPQNISKLDSKWRTVLQDLNQKSVTTDELSVEVNKKSKYILSVINGDLKNLEELILDDAFCEEAVYLLTQKTEQGLSISQKTLENFYVLLTNAKYSLCVKANSAIVISNVAKSKQKVPSTTLQALVKYLCSTNDIGFRNTAWLALGYCASECFKDVVNGNLLAALADALNETKTALNATFTAKCIFEAMSATNKTLDFLSIFKNINFVLENKNNIYCADTVYNALLAVLHAAKKELALPTALLNRIGSMIGSTSCSDDNKCIALEIINAVLQKQNAIEFEESLLIQIIVLLKSNNKIIRNNANHILLAYLDKTKLGLSVKLLKALADLMTNEELVFLVLEIFKKTISLKLNFTSCVLDNVSRCLSSINEESRINAAWILKKSTGKDLLSNDSLTQLQHAIDDHSYDVKYHAISALKKCLVGKKTIIFSSDTCISLASLIAKANDNYKLQSSTLDLLYLISSSGQRFDSYVINILEENLKLPSFDFKNAIVKIISFQFALHADFKSEVFDSVIKSLEYLLLEDEISTSVVLALAEAKKHNYSLSKKTLQNLACSLLSAADKDFRKQAYAIISTEDDCKLSREIKIIRSIEDDAVILMSHSDSELQIGSAQRVAALRLWKFANEQHLMTVSVWSAFESVMSAKQHKLHVLITEVIYFAMQNGQKPSEKLLESLVSFVKDNANHLDISFATKSLVLAGKDGRYFSEETFSLFEDLFSREVKSELSVEYLQLIELGVKRYGKLKNNILNKILHCLSHKNRELQLSVARIVYSLSKNKICDCTVIDFVLKSLENCDDKVLIKYFCKIIISLANQIDQKSFTGDLSLLNDQLDKVEDNNLKFELIALLKRFGQLATEQSQIKFLSRLKDQSSILLKPISTLINHIDVRGLVVLKRLGQFISGQTQTKSSSQAVDHDLTFLEPINDLIESLCKPGSVASNSGINFTPLFKDRVLKLIKLGWSTKKLYDLLVKIEAYDQNKYDFECIYMAFDIACYGGISEAKFHELDFSSFSHSGFTKLHQRAMKTLFSDDECEKDQNTLLEEIANNDSNKISTFFNGWIYSGKARKMLEQQATFSSTKQNLPSQYKSQLPIKDWEIAHIHAWAVHIKAITNKQENIWPEMFAVISRAFLLQWKYEPRNSQWIAVLALLSGNRLAEIPTGEGKTAIIAIWAVIKALYNIPVDVITSSSVLAKRDAKLNKDFYQMFNLKVASNEDDKSRNGLKKCYSKDVAIVYGDLSNFQFDLLREEYSLLGTRGNRPFGVAIIDEVDSPLVDGSSKVAMLSSSMPGIRQLQPMMIVIWQELQNLLGQIICIDNKTFVQVSNTQHESEKKLYQLDNQRDYLFVKIHEHITAIIENSTDTIIIPNHLKTFAKQQLPKWIAHALIAHFDYELDHQYKIGLNQLGLQTILPLDFANTGQTQKGSTWSDGLQQFLQIKHGLKFTPESLITNLMSNSAFVERYKGNICGLTGTLGSQQTRAFLAKNYGVDFIDLPSHKTKRFAMLPNIAAQTQEAWQDEIVASACREAKAGRVVIILSETIAKANKILAHVTRVRKSGQIKSYIESDSDQSRFLDDTLQGNTIIVATNLAGRGTDPKISEEVIKKYGVHVIFTFLPINSRVHQQGLGRAGRAGKPGTGQIILNLQDLYTPEIIKSLKPKQLTVEAIIKQRDINEAAYLHQFENEELPRIKIKDQLFHQFCELLKELKEIDRLDENKPLDESYYHCKRQAVEERWGLWLKQQAIKPPFESIKDEFNKFKQQILSDYKNDTVIQNPFYYIRYANNLLAYADSFKSKIRNFLQIDSTTEIYNVAISIYDKAIALDPICSYLAYYYKAYALIKLGDDTSKNAAKDCLIKAKAILEEHIIKQLIATASTITAEAKNGELAHQLSYEINALKNLCCNIEESLDAINRANKKVDLKFLADNKINPSLFVAEAMKQINDSNIDRFSLSVYHFKTYLDVKRICEAESAIDAMQDHGTVNIVFSSQSIKRYEQQTWQELLPINQQPKEENEKVTHSNQKAQEQEKIGLYENVTATTNKVFSSFSGLLSKAKKGINNKIINPLENWWQDYEQAKKIPVNICFKNLRVTDIEAIFEQLKKLIQAPLNINIKLFNKNKSFSNNLTSFDVENTFPQFKENEYQHDEFTLVFSDVAQDLASKVLTVAPVNTTLTFSALTKQNAKRILPFTAPYHDQAVFEFNNISKEQALKLLKAVPAERSLESKFQSLESMLPHTSFATSELLEYQANGWFNFFSLAEQRPRPWRSIILLATTSLLQITTGFVLTALTAGFAANMGMALTVEGLCDAIRGLNAFRSGQFDLNSYLLQKTVSLSWSLLTVGLSSLSVANKAVSASEQLGFTLTEVADEAAFQMIMNAKSTALKQTAQSLLTNATKMAVQEGTGVVLETGIYYANNTIQKSICSQVALEVERITNEELFQTTLQKIFAIDTFLETETYQAKLCSDIQNRLVELSNKYTLGLDKFQTIVDSYALLNFLNEFKVIFAAAVSNVQLPNFSDLLRKKLRAKLNDQQIEQICNLLRDKKILNENVNISLQPLCSQKDLVLSYANFDKTKLDSNRLKLAELELYKSKIIDICVSFYMASNDRHYLQKNRLIQTISNVLTSTIVKSMESIHGQVKGGCIEIIGNVAGAAASKIFDKLTMPSPVVSGTAGGSSKFTAKKQHRLVKVGQVKTNKGRFLAQSWQRQSESTSAIPEKQQTRSQTTLPNSAGQFSNSITRSLANGRRNSFLPQKRADLATLTNRRINQSKIKSGKATFRGQSSQRSSESHSISSQRINRKRTFLRSKHDATSVAHITGRVPSSIQPVSGKSIFDPAEIFGFDSLDKFLFDLSVSTIKNAALVQYQKALINEYKVKITVFREKLQQYFKDKTVLDDKLIDEARKLIKLMLGLFILEVKFSVASQQKSEEINFNQEEIQNAIEQLFKECVEHPDKEYDILKNYLQRFDSEVSEIPQIISELKQSFLEFNQLIKEAKIMLDAASGAITKWSGDINMGDVVGKVMKSIDDRNYSQAGLLLREGKLGENGFLAGSMIEGMMNCHMASIKSHERMQFFLIKLAEKMVASQNNFLVEIVNIEKSRQDLVKTIDANYLRKLDEAFKLVIEVDVAKKDLAMKALELVDTYYKASKAVAKANGIDPDFQSKCIVAHQNVMTSLMDTLKNLGAQQSNSLIEGIKASKEIILKAIESTPGKNNKSANQDQAQLPQIAGQPAQAAVAPNQNVAAQAAVALNPQPQAQPEPVHAWKASLDKANAAYSDGKKAYKAGNKKSAGEFFKQAKNSYIDLEDAPLGKHAKARLDKRLGKLTDEGMYSSKTLSK